MSRIHFTQHFSSFFDALFFLKTVKWEKAVNFLMLLANYVCSLLFKKIYVSGLPSTVSIEPTTLCNLKCPECPTGSNQLTRRRGNMEMVVYDSILNQIEKTTLWLLLYFQGEPFLHPEIFSMIRKANERKLYTILSTNGHYLDEDNCKELIEAGLNRIIISLDGSDEETYNKYRKNGDFEKVLEGIKTVTRIKRTMKSHKPLVILQFLVFRHNQDQIKSIRELGKHVGADKVQIKSAQIYNFREKAENIPTDTKYSRYYFKSNNEPKLKSELKNKCRRLWHTSVITAEGDIVPCCFDKQADYKMGNIMKNPFQEIWQNKAYNNFRRKVLTNRKEISICRNCTE